MAFGTRMESIVIRRFEEEMGLSVQASGLFVDLENGFLGASPDVGLIRDSHIIEVKCLYKVHKSGLPLREAILSYKTLCLEIVYTKIRLKRNHEIITIRYKAICPSLEETCAILWYISVIQSRCL